MKGINRYRRNKRRGRFLSITAAVIGTVAIGAAIYVTGPPNKDNGWTFPAEILVKYMNHIPEQEYEQIYENPDTSQEDTEEIIDICLELYKENENNVADLETIRSIVNRLGENGYPAVDSRNQIDMTEAGQVVQFCEMVDAKEEAEITIIQISDLGGFVKYDLQTKNGNVDVTRNYYKYEDGNIQRQETGSYSAENWNYTEDGYLMFSGAWFSEEQYTLTLSSAEEHIAFRVQPLEETYRELNRKYILPIGYERNNMFLVDWSEDDFGSLNFYDMYDILYPKINAAPVPYTADDDLGVGAVYRIPKDEFESVIMTCFNIDSETLQSKTTYYSEDSAYEYKPRGFYEAEYPEYPYSEVVGYTENSDGTITLTVNVVFPYTGDSKVYAHEVVVRPMEDGGVQYVSNRIIPSEENVAQTWHTPRLTEEEWEALYGGEITSVEAAKSVEEEAEEQWAKGYNLPVDEQEEAEAENDCSDMMELVFDIYEDADKGKVSEVVLGDETVLEMQKKVMETGCPVAASVTYCNMENYESVDKFLEECMDGKSGAVVIYNVHDDGGIGRMKFIFDGTDMYLLSARGAWNDNKPVVSYISYTGIKAWRYTDKGWFCYELCVPEYPEVTEIVDGSCLIRVKPMTEEQREMSERCVLGLGYQGNNILCSNWDTDHLDKLDYNGMYEYLYAMKYEKAFNPETYPNGIPKEAFESLIMEYFPVTAEQIREYAAFDEENQTYIWVRLGCFNYAPTFFGTSLPEVTDIRENEDGTVTLTVDAVCDMVVCDDAVITHELTVRFAGDGSFQYLGNKILNDGIKDIPNYQYRVCESMLQM